MRAKSLDVFRGITIFLMILSAIIPAIFPAWMFHAQVGPRSNFAFDPSIYGITWVDLIFPFFLFAMGVSIPFSIGNKIDRGESRYKIVGDILLRSARLTFFALFIQHIYPWNSYPDDITKSKIVAIIGFVLLFVMFLKLPFKLKPIYTYGIELVGYLLGAGLLFFIVADKGGTFSFNNSNIIILVLANMALWGMLIYLFTIGNQLKRLLVLPLLLALILSSRESDSWQQVVANYSPVSWFYQFSFLKYLFIVIPATFVGDWFKNWTKYAKTNPERSSLSKRGLIAISFFILLLLVTNLICLYNRSLLTNLIITSCLLGGIYYSLKRGENSYDIFLSKVFKLASYFLLLGLFIEAFEGGIRKDNSTFSYYFVTAGLASLLFMFLSLLCDYAKLTKLGKLFMLTGQNPMMAYVAPQLFVYPILYLVGVMQVVDIANQSIGMALLSCVILTLLPVLLASYFSYKKLFWKT